MKWFRLYHDLPSDRKLRKFSPQEKWAWVCLLCFASQNTIRGEVVGEDEDILAEDCGFGSVQDFRYYLDKLRAKGLIEQINNGFKIVNWKKLQYASDSSGERVRRHRQQKCNVTETLPQQPSNVSVTPPDTDTDTDPDTNSDSDPNQGNPERADAQRHEAPERPERKNQPPEQQPTATSYPPEPPARQPQTTLAQNSTLEISPVPSSIPRENDQQDALTLPGDVSIIQQKSEGLPRRLTASERSTLIDQAVGIYNQYRLNWHECAGLSPRERSNLEKLLLDPNQTAQGFLDLVRDATMFYANDSWHNKPEFDSKFFSFLVGRIGNNNRLIEAALKWRSLPLETKAGIAIKMSQPKEKTYCDLSGNSCSKPTAFSTWWAISRKARAGEGVSTLEKNWANLYFPGYDIYQITHELD
jgi:hypothetical protein